MVLNDNSPMPYGKYQGREMANVPAEHLLWLWENDKCCKDVREYIEDNMDVLEKELKESTNTSQYEICNF